MYQRTEASYSVAALFVMHDTIYRRLGCDVWDEERDARLYDGPFPVVAHPPCGTWGKYASQHGTYGQDGGIFESALHSVRRWSGVLEHPRDSGAFHKYGLGKPMPGSWQRHAGGWITEIQQWAYGHRGIKTTWLYAVSRHEPMPLLWDVRAPRGNRFEFPELNRGQALRASQKAKGVIPIESMCGKERAQTPEMFALLLCSIALDSRL